MPTLNNYTPQTDPAQTPDLNNPTATFAQKMNELEQIAGALGNPQLDLEQAMSLFQRGLQLSRECQNQLTGFEKQINTLMAQEQENNG